MISTIHIQNFQCHEDTTIQLDQITTLTGPNDSGKSAVLRALCWALFNKPSGFGFLRRAGGAEEARVTLTVDDHTVARVRNGRENYYELDGQRFEAMGQGVVPDPIAKLFNVGPSNIQRQHDLPFWFSLTAGQLSKEMNQIVDLDKIDTVLSIAASGARACKATLDVAQDRLTAARATLERTEWAVSATASVERLTTIQKSIDSTRSRIDSLRSLIHDRENAQTERTNALAAMPALLHVLAEGKRVAELQRRKAELDQLLTSARKLREVKRPPSLETLTKHSQEFWSLQSRIVALKSIITERARAQQERERCHELARAGHEKLHKAMQGRCPVCKQPMPKST